MQFTGDASGSNEIGNDTVAVRRVDLYALLDSLTSVHTGLMSVWDPEATVSPLSDARRLATNRALLISIADLRNWLE